MTVGAISGAVSSAIISFCRRDMVSEATPTCSPWEVPGWAAPANMSMQWEIMCSAIEPTWVVPVKEVPEPMMAETRTRRARASKSPSRRRGASAIMSSSS